MGKTRLASGLGLGALVAIVWLFAGQASASDHREADRHRGLEEAGEQLGIQWFSPYAHGTEDRPVRIDPSDAAGLNALFRRQGFLMSGVRDGALAVPRLYVTRLPGDLRKLRQVEQRKQLFLRAVLPLILMNNERLRAERGRLLSIKERRQSGRAISAGDQNWLAGMADDYDTAPDDLDALLLKVDLVPVSLALAQAILESGWGTSRFAVKGNALFGETAPVGNGPHMVKRDGTNVRFRAFPDLMESVRSYMHNLNTHPAYRAFRKRRAAERAEGLVPSAKRLLPTLDSYAELPGYLRRIRGLIHSNRLDQLEGAHLDRNWFASRPLNF
ncbi:Bax protein [Tistlia consotensis]|uniref:Bax protein n=1 Tax=Tistlia consotensis USBA 355 TaxID=560819 RepID=A0A1Y6CRP6_9PROT|nr:glucosaminidase domain-containing protein [Tistlia consotensis]SMF74379.1 Bax protein [Tistlia consotensis USBA 355]SNS10443.1 Bax protein [Tistlia consotensis]